MERRQAWSILGGNVTYRINYGAQTFENEDRRSNIVRWALFDRFNTNDHELFRFAFGS